MASVDSVVLEGWSTFFGEIACFLRDCERNEDTTDQRKLEYICERLENCIAHIRILYAQIDEEVADSDDGLPELDSGMSGLLVVLNEKLPYWREKLEVSYQSEPTTVILPPVCHNPRRRGRPPFEIHPEQILFLRELNFTWQTIATMLGVSRMTLYRKRVEAGISEDPRLDYCIAQTQSFIIISFGIRLCSARYLL